jgi:NTE family protein
MTVAFVLSGGGNLGAAQVGMLQALDDAGIRPDLVVGTSAGAINGSWVAAGGDIRELGSLWRGLRRADVFPFRPVTGFLGAIGARNHLVSQGPLRSLLAKHLLLERIEEAVIPFHVIATDVLKGVDVRISHGPALEAVLASTAIPAVFPPVVIDGTPLMDGGVVDNTPISHAVELGAETIWVLTTGYACDLRRPPRSALAMALHAIGLTIHQRLAFDVERYTEHADLRVVPPLCPLSVSPTDFSQAEQLISRAREHTARWLREGEPGRRHLEHPIGHDRH